MAINNYVPGLNFFPEDLHETSTSALGQATIDATGEAAAVLWRSPIDGNITALRVLFGTVTTGDTISGEIQSVLTATAFPSDTLYSAGAAGAFSLTTTMANTWQVITLGSPAAVSVGTQVALVVKRADAGGAGVFQVRQNSVAGDSMPVGATKALTWTSSQGTLRCIEPIYSETAAVAALQMFASWLGATAQLSAAAANAEVGNRITLPFAARIRGWYANLSASPGSVTKIRLYAADGTSMMAESRLDGKLITGVYWKTFASPTTMAANTLLRVAAYVSAGACTLFGLSAANATAMQTLNLGSLCHASSRSGPGGAWSDVQGLRYRIGLLIDGLDDSTASGVAGGSGLAHIIGGGL